MIIFYCTLSRNVFVGRMYYHRILENYIYIYSWPYAENRVDDWKVSFPHIIISWCLVTSTYLLPMLFYNICMSYTYADAFSYHYRVINVRLACKIKVGFTKHAVLGCIYVCIIYICYYMYKRISGYPNPSHHDSCKT